MESYNIGDTVTLRLTGIQATIVGIAYYQTSETMFLVSYNDGGVSTSQWRTASDFGSLDVPTPPLGE